jgi:hypothetical protein
MFMIIRAEMNTVYDVVRRYGLLTDAQIYLMNLLITSKIYQDTVL